MKYEKPELTRLESAAVAIQSCSIPKALTPNDSNHEPSVTAYEADE
jgi:hypothetical protein